MSAKKEVILTDLIFQLGKLLEVFTHANSKTEAATQGVLQKKLF